MRDFSLNTKATLLFCYVMLILVTGCTTSQSTSSLNDSTSDSILYSSNPQAPAANAYPDGEYCSDLEFVNEKVGVAGNFEVTVEIKDGELIRIDAPMEISSDLSKVALGRVTPEGSCTIKIDSDRSYHIQIKESGSCKNDEAVSEDHFTNGNGEEQVIRPILSNYEFRSWAKDNFSKYLENREFREYLSKAEDNLKELETDIEREEAKKIITLFETLSRDFVICRSHFDDAVNDLGISYSQKPLNSDLSIMKFTFGDQYYYAVANRSSSTGYAFEIYANRGQLEVYRNSRNVNCSFLAGVSTSGKEYRLNLDYANPIELCRPTCL